MNTDATYTYGKLNTSQLKVDMSYQRPLDTSKVKKIACNFNPLKVNDIKVSHRDGAYYIFDGQHTTKILVTRNGGEDLFVECKIYEGLTREDEAELFARQNDGDTAVPKNCQLKALHTSGDVEVRELKRTVEDAGFIFDFSTSPGSNKLICCAKVLKIFRSARESDFRRFLDIIKYSWHGSPDSLRKEIVGGMWKFYITYKGGFDYDIAIQKFSRVSPLEIIRDGKAAKVVSGDARYACVMAEIYNKRLRTNKLDLKKLIEK